VHRQPIQDHRHTESWCINDPFKLTDTPMLHQ
jgi:hypothetical protein